MEFLPKDVKQSLPRSCLQPLGVPVDGGAWWAAIYGVAWGHEESEMTERIHFHFSRGSWLELEVVDPAKCPRAKPGQ